MKDPDTIRFGVTYEGLKHYRGPHDLEEGTGFGVTYEGLKPVRIIAASIALRVLELPMRV